LIFNLITQEDSCSSTLSDQAKYAVRSLQPGLFDVAYVAHPSFVEADELKAIQGPLSIAAAGKSLCSSV
jgi:hypothetical protein